MEQTTDMLAQFNQMKQSGVIDSLESLTKEKLGLERIINDILDIVPNTSIDSMFELIKKFLDYFIPKSMVFVLKSPRKDALYHYFYRNLIRTNDKFPENDYEVLKNYFTINHRSSNLFKEILTDLPPNSFTKECIELEPAVIIPLTGIGGVYGIVVLSEKITGDMYTETELLYMQRMFTILALTIQNGLHYESSITDPKTGLFTFDHFLHRTHEIFDYCHQHKKYSGILMLDIDNFKKIQ